MSYNAPPQWNWEQTVTAFFAVVPVWYFLVAAALYLPAVFWGQRFMRNRNAYDLRIALGVWNTVMAVLSGYAGVQLLFHAFLPRFFEVCSLERYSVPAVQLVFIFNVTKALEWVDTLFLILRKRPVRFIHYFHHLVTMLYCLHATFFNPWADASGIYFATVNLLVHWIMYAYYAQVAFGVTWVRSYGKYLTFLQAAQMVFGLVVLVWSTVACPLSWQNNWHGTLFAGGMYATYLYLFGSLLRDKWFGSRRAKGD